MNIIRPAPKELYADSVQFSYKSSQQLLTGAYLKCQTGDIIALLGRNGCGKSTFLKILFGVLRAEYCYLKLNGRRIKKAYLSKKIGYLPQHSFLPTHQKVRSLIRLFLSNEFARNLLREDSRIQKIIDLKIHQLSAGELRYLEIYLLMMQPTDFLLLDEPFTGLEPKYCKLIAELILKNRDHKGFVLSDHQYHNVLAIATEILLLENGCCRKLREPRDLEFFYLPEGTFK